MNSNSDGNQISVTNKELNNEDLLKSLAWAITNSEGQFKLILARCNYVNLREQITLQLLKIYPIKIREVFLNQYADNLYSTIQEKLGNEQPTALIVFGLESVIEINKLLTSLNQVREELSRKFSFPLLLWINDEIVLKLIRIAPDLKNWATTFEFTISNNELINLISETTDDVFKKVLNSGAGKFLGSISINLNLEPISPRRIELELAQKELKSRKLKIELELEASLEFILGLAKDNSWKDSWKHYQHSLKLWQQNNNSIRYGCVLYYLGRWYRTFASKYANITEKVSKKACGKARDYFEQSIEIFEQCKRPDLVAKFINSLGEVLQQLEQWNELEKAAKRLLNLHPAHSDDQFRLARAYGFLAQVALHQHQPDWTNVEQYAQRAIESFQRAREVALKSDLTVHRENSDLLVWEDSYHLGWYLLPLAKVQLHQQKIEQAMKNLEMAKKVTKPQYDVKLYLQILEELRLLYFAQGDYLKAFDIKKERREIKRQYGFRSFIGAERLQPEKTITNPALQAHSFLDKQDKISKEINVSERQKDVENLVKRMARHDHKLTVIYGASGVGKSSLLQAGLIPALKQKPIGNRHVLSILIQEDYTHWINKLSTSLKKSFEEVKEICLINLIPSEKYFLERLEKHEQEHLLTIIIFDEFEEFFLSFRSLDKRKEFYNFLQKCLKIPFVKIIFLLRDDYLKYLSEITRNVNLEINNNELLNENILYYLGNFSPEEAKSIIRKLIKSVELSLINKLVDDLAVETDEVSPIELQIVMAQIETKKITTLEEYLKCGKEKLIEQYLSEVINDCGSENESYAQKILYILTDKNNSRLVKTRTELITNLESIEEEKLDLILNILKRSSLIFETQESTSKYYKLAHDYLVSLIRQLVPHNISEELELTKAQLRKALHQIAIDEIEALNSLAESRWQSHDQLGALLASLKAGKKLKEIITEPNLRIKTISILGQLIYRIQEKNRFEGHTNSVNSVSFSPDGQILVSASADYKIKLWSIEGRELETFVGHDSEVNSVSFSPDGTRIASASADGTIKLWNLNGEELKTFRGHSTFVNHVCFSPDGTMLASASADHTIKLWNLNGEELNMNTFCGHTSFVNSVSFSPDGTRIASASADGLVKLWDVKSGLNLRDQDFFVGKNVEVNSISFSRDGKLLVSANADCTLSLWSRDLPLKETLKGHGSHVKIVRFSLNADESYIASASADGILKLWSTEGIELQTVKAHDDEILSLCFSPDGQILASASADNTVKLWKLLINRELKTFLGHKEFVNQVCFSPDGKMIASASTDRTVKLWSLEGKKLATCRGHSSFVNSVCFSPDGKMIASTSTDRTIKLWDLQERQQKSWEGHQTWVNRVCFSPDGQRLASAGADGKIKIWNLDGEELNAFGDDRAVKSLCFSPDGQILASACTDYTFKLWSLKGQQRQTLNHQGEGHQGWVIDICFSPDGQMIASASKDSTVKLWNINGQLLQNFTGHSSEVNSVSFSPDGKTLISASADGMVKWWSLDGKELRTLPGYGIGCRSIGVSPEGNRIVLGNFDGTLTLCQSNLRFDLDDLLRRSCDWIRDYLATNATISASDKDLCKTMR